MTPAQKEAIPGLVAEVERSRDIKKAQTEHEREIFARAKELGIEGKALRKVIQRRAENPTKRDAFEAVVAEYESALAPAKREALEAIERGASTKAAAKAAGLPRSTLRHVVGGGEKSDLPEHDADGVIPESAPAPSPSGPKATHPSVDQASAVPNSPADTSIREDDKTSGKPTLVTSAGEPESTFPSEGEVPEIDGGPSIPVNPNQGGSDEYHRSVPNSEVVAPGRRRHQVEPHAGSRVSGQSALSQGAQSVESRHPLPLVTLDDGTQVPPATALPTPGQMLLKKLMAGKPDVQERMEKADPGVRRLVEATAGLVASGDLDGAAAVVAIAKASRNRPRTSEYCQDIPPDDDGLSLPPYLRRAKG